MEQALKIRFWGVRGSTPTPEPENLGYGGNTACLEVRCDGRPVVLDAGTGVRRLGLALLEEFGPQGAVDLFFSHFHWDHLQGLPFFAPLYQPGWEISFRSAALPEVLEQVLRRQMMQPYFTAEAAVRAKVRYAQVPPEGVECGAVLVKAFPLWHPGGCSAYRIEAASASIIYATDHEHGHAPTDESLRCHAEGAALLIADAQYTPEEYGRHRGWGHSTWEAAVLAAREASVRQLILFHHDPGHDDAAISRIEAAARAGFAPTLAAREGEFRSTPPA